MAALNLLLRSIGLSILCMTAIASQAAGPAAGQTATQPKATESQSAHDFVQGFYDWYGFGVDKNDHSMVDAALASKRWPMSDAIVAALKADEAAQEEVPDEIVGIDFDPFTASQDDCSPYKAGQVTKTGNQYQVEIFDNNDLCKDPHPELPYIVTVLEKHGGSWVFVNFLYPREKDDLLSTLKGLKEEREKEAKQPN